jgi:hypothetical protein
MKHFKKGVAIEHWTWSHRNAVRMWLVKNFGAHGDRWQEYQDYDFLNLEMDEDVYVWYELRWSNIKA